MQEIVLTDEITASNYFDDVSHLSNSMMGELNKSPLHLWHYMDNPHMRKTSDAMELGSAIHCAVFEPSRFEEDYICLPAGDARTKKWKEETGEIKDANPDKKFLKAQDYNKVMDIKGSLWDKPEVEKLINSGEAEKIGKWEIEGVKCKGRADLYNKEHNYLVDLKTTTDISPEAFIKKCIALGYDRQAAFYSHGFEVESFYFIAVEKEPPYAVAIFECTEEFLNEGRKKYEHLIMEYKRAFVLGDFSNPREYVQIHTL